MRDFGHASNSGGLCGDGIGGAVLLLVSGSRADVCEQSRSETVLESGSLLLRVSIDRRVFVFVCVCVCPSGYIQNTIGIFFLSLQQHRDSANNLLPGTGQHIRMWLDLRHRRYLRNDVAGQEVSRISEQKEQIIVFHNNHYPVTKTSVISRWKPGTFL